MTGKFGSKLIVAVLVVVGLIGIYCCIKNIYSVFKGHEKGFGASDISFNFKEADSRIEGQLVSIAGKQFLIPYDFNAVYEKDAGAIRFAFDANTFQTLNHESTPEKKKTLVNIIVVADGSSPYGEQDFWPNPLRGNIYFNCSSYIIKDKKYELCQYDRRDEPIHIWGRDLYVLREKDATNPILLIGCAESKKNKSLNPTCEGKGVILGNIHIRYTYSINNFENAFFIDQAIRQIVTYFYNLAEEKRNVIHAYSK